MVYKIFIFTIEFLIDCGVYGVACCARESDVYVLLPSCVVSAFMCLCYSCVQVACALTALMVLLCLPSVVTRVVFPDIRSLQYKSLFETYAIFVASGEKVA